MPSDDRIGLDDGQVAAPTGKDTRQNSPESSIRWLQSWPFGVSLKDLELMAQGDVLEGELISGLQASDDGAKDNIFGYSIAISNGVVAVGAHWDDDNGNYSGSAYLFDASTGAQIAKLLPSDGLTWDYFGYSIAIDNGVVAVGAPYAGNAGAAYLFNASTGEQIAKLLARPLRVALL